MSACRILTLEELEIMKPEFIRFLAAHGISAKDWDQWTKNKPRKQAKYIELFSEFVFFSIIQKSKYWQKKLEDGIQFVQIADDVFNMLWFKTIENAEAGNQDSKTMDVYTKVKKIESLHKNQEVQELFNMGFLPIKTTQNDEVYNIFQTYFSGTGSE